MPEHHHLGRLRRASAGPARNGVADPACARRGLRRTSRIPIRTEGAIPIVTCDWMACEDAPTILTTAITTCNRPIPWRSVSARLSADRARNGSMARGVSDDKGQC